MFKKKKLQLWKFLKISNVFLANVFPLCCGPIFFEIRIKINYQENVHMLRYCGNAKLLCKFLNVSSQVLYSFHPRLIPNSSSPGTGPRTTSVGILLVGKGSTH